MYREDQKIENASLQTQYKIPRGVCQKNPSMVVIVPVYRTVLTTDEDLSLKQLFTILQGRQIVFIHPKSMDTSAYQKWPAKALQFEDRCFRTAADYSGLLLSLEFYNHFREYEFMLIHQTDVFLCQNNLTFFTHLEIDYIGAPWLTPKRCPFWCLRGSRFFAFPWLMRAFSVGNGGLSLRRVNKIIEVLEQNPFYAAAARLTGTHEDVFYSSLRGDGPARLRIPDQQIALSFAFDRDPRACYAANGYRLPFGLHNPWGYDRDFFFKEILPQCHPTGSG